MKRQGLMILTTLSLFVMLTAMSVYAQFDSVLVANIPFQFMIGNTAFPAGEYTVTYMDTHLMRVQSQDHSESIFVITGPAQARKMGNRLVFNRYGDQYFLSTIWRTGDPGRAIRMSRSERKLVQATSALDKSAPAPQIVSVMFVGK